MSLIRVVVNLESDTPVAYRRLIDNVEEPSDLSPSPDGRLALSGHLELGRQIQLGDEQK